MNNKVKERVKSLKNHKIKRKKISKKIKKTIIISRNKINKKNKKINR